MLFKCFTTIILILGLCLSLEAKKLVDADCRPRATVVPVSTDHEYKPYHIVLYQCSGTYERTSPSIKRCVATEEHDVSVDVKDEHNNEVTVTLKNHTKCGGGCASSCFMQDHDCRCPPPSTPKASNREGLKDPNKSLPLPYMVGMALVGFFAIFVLIFDAMLFVKKKGFMHTIKTCGKSQYPDKNENQHKENDPMVSNGKESNKKDTVV